MRPYVLYQAWKVLTGFLKKFLIYLLSLRDVFNKVINVAFRILAAAEIIGWFILALLWFYARCNECTWSGAAALPTQVIKWGLLNIHELVNLSHKQRPLLHWSK